MARPLRIDYAGAFHHVTNRGARGQRTFLTDADRWDFYDLLGKVSERFGVEIHAFAFMDNHFHLIIETPNANLSKAMKLLESWYVQRFNRRHGTNGPLYQDRFYSKLIQADDYLAQAILYVMRNPLKAGMVDKLSEYPWTSYPYFMDSEFSRPEWLSTRGLEMGGIYTAADLDAAVHRTSPEDRFDLDDFAQVIGTDSFVAAALERATRDPETVGHLRKARIRPTFAEIESVIRSIFDLGDVDLRSPSPGRRSPGRMVAVLLAQELGGMSLQAIAAQYQFLNERCAGGTASRCRQLALNDPIFAQQIEQVRQVLKDGRVASAGR